MNALAQALLAWYDRHKRPLPWRETRDPYAIWVSETMLQQTRVETVLAYYPRFLSSFPTLEKLAQAPTEAVLKAWEGLGYYRRARNLQAGARQVLAEHGGQLPQDPDKLRRITGIGPYTAGALASIAFGLPCPAVDGNVIRVVSRVAGIRADTELPSVRRQIAQTVSAWLPPQRPGDFNQALMDLGSALCRPGSPDCSRCPLAALCDARAAGDAPELPRRTHAPAPRALSYDVALVLQGERVLLTQRRERLLEGLWVFPLAEGLRSPDALAAWLRRSLGLPCAYERPLGPARHVFTHQVWEMQLHLLRADAGAVPARGRFVTLAEMAALPLPAAMRQAQCLAAALLTKGDAPC